MLDPAGRTAARGYAPRADPALRRRLADRTDGAAGRADPRRLMLRGRLRPHGNPRVLWALPTVMT
jgi:hypothetical protein